MVLDDQTKIELVQMLKEAVKEAVESHPLSPEEVHWVRMAIKAEAERASLRKAIIEKSLAGLAWMALAGIGTWAVSFFADHWK
jgi:hypothetical protein